MPASRSGARARSSARLSTRRLPESARGEESSGRKRPSTKTKTLHANTGKESDSTASRVTGASSEPGSSNGTRASGITFV